MSTAGLFSKCFKERKHKRNFIYLVLLLSCEFYSVFQNLNELINYCKKMQTLREQLLKYANN